MPFDEDFGDTDLGQLVARIEQLVEARVVALVFVSPAGRLGVAYARDAVKTDLAEVLQGIDWAKDVLGV